VPSARDCDSVGFGRRPRRSGGNSADPRGVWAELMRFLVLRACDFASPCPVLVGSLSVHCMIPALRTWIRGSFMFSRRL